MSTNAPHIMRTALTALHATGLARGLAPLARGQGVVFTLHSVTPEPVRPFEPNRILKVTPDFLETAIVTVRKRGYDIVSLDEAARRMRSETRERPFACFTLDDGYRDNRDHAYPVFKKHDAPFAIYVPAAYADGEGDLWWYVLENAIAKTDRVRVVLDGIERVFDATTAETKDRAFYEIYWPLRARPETELRATVQAVAAEAGYDASRLCRDLIMSWDEIRALAADPLVTIGAHTCRHFAVAKLSEEEARREIADSVARIACELGRPCRHFSFPYGDTASAGPRDFAIARALGLETAVTTQKDVVRRGVDRHGLPRVSLNGDYQAARFVEVLLTGVPFRMFDAAQTARAYARRLAGARGKAAAIASPPIRRPDAASI